MKYFFFSFFLFLSLPQLISQQWHPSQTLEAFDPARGISFGYSMGADSTTIIVGNSWDSNDEFGRKGLAQSGSLYFFERNASGDFILDSKIKASDKKEFGGFGGLVAITHNRIFTSGGGAFYVLEKTNLNAWEEVSKISVPAGYSPFFTSSSIDISQNQAIIGLRRKPYTFFISEVGGANVYERDASGNWDSVATLLPNVKIKHMFFGTSVSIQDNRIVVGAPGNFDIDPPYRIKGSVYVFEKNVGGTWVQVQKIQPTDSARDDRFGIEVDLRKDKLIVGGKESAYIFELDSAGIWQESAKLIPPPGQYNYSFGYTVSIRDNLAVVGSSYEGEPFPSLYYRVGAVYVYEKNANNNWHFTNKVSSPTGQHMGNFGSRVVASNGYIAASFYGVTDPLVGPNTGELRILTPCKPSASTLTPFVCNSYTSPSGKHTWSDSGTYFDTLSNSAGNDSIIKICLTVRKVMTEVNLHNAQAPTRLLAVSFDSLHSYQWLDCQNGFTPIPGATQRFFTPINGTVGTYAVEIRAKNGCIDTSACKSVSTVAIQQGEGSLTADLYPNPGNGKFNLNFSTPVQDVTLSILDVWGRKVFEKQYKKADNLAIDIESSPGIYIVQARTRDGKTGIWKVIKN